jgi:plastocyanin
MKTKLWLSAVAVSTLLSGAAIAQVTGTVVLDGKAPEPKEINMAATKECADQHTDPPLDETIVAGEKGELKNVIVFLKKEEGMDVPAEVPKETAVLDQKGCQYIPHVLPVMIGQKVSIKNDDNFGHNVHSFSKENPPFNFAQNKDPGKPIDPFKTVETIMVKCDVHPWMLAYVRVFDHPFFAASAADGKFAINAKGLPDGEYTFVAWHEKLGEQEAKATVAGGKAEGLKFTFKAASVQAPAVPAATNLMLASDTKDATCITTAGACCTKAPETSVAVNPEAKAVGAVEAQAKAK